LLAYVIGERRWLARSGAPPRLRPERLVDGAIAIIRILLASGSMWLPFGRRTERPKCWHANRIRTRSRLLV